MTRFFSVSPFRRFRRRNARDGLPFPRLRTPGASRSRGTSLSDGLVVPRSPIVRLRAGVARPPRRAKCGARHPRARARRARASRGRVARRLRRDVLPRACPFPERTGELDQKDAALRGASSRASRRASSRASISRSWIRTFARVAPVWYPARARAYPAALSTKKMRSAPSRR